MPETHQTLGVISGKGTPPRKTEPAAGNPDAEAGVRKGRALPVSRPFAAASPSVSQGWIGPALQ